MRPAILLLALLLPGFVRSQAVDQAQVEVVAFAWKGARVGNTHLGPPLDTAFSVELRADGGGSYAAVPGTALASAYQRLRADPRTMPLLHVAWRQSLGDGRYVRLRAAPQEGYALDGRVQVRGTTRGTLLVELELTDSEGNRHQLVQTRPFQPGQVHHFDHPAFGLLLTVASEAVMVNVEEL